VNALRIAFQGATALVHLGGMAHTMPTPTSDLTELYRKANVDSTRAAFRAAAQSGIKACIFLSSVKAGVTAAPRDDTVPSRVLDSYGNSKLEAEEVALEIASQQGMRAVVFRPTLLIGPGVKGNMRHLLAAVFAGRPLPFGSIRNRRSFLAVTNLAAAIAAALAAEQASGVFFLADTPPLSTPDLVRRLADGLGCSPWLLNAPQSLLRGFGRLGDFFGGQLPFILTSEAVERLVGSLVVDSSGFDMAVGFHRPTSLFAEINRMTEWYLQVRGNPPARPLQ
jgi:nucleoside-diphosphate-sugar epimerase